ncbi:hypothetical protein BaRGS_00010401 [Batillaria attramentaria]|uniref:Uncharacterized protein n=1 Tax=Batillaria attramentaria TaxID=370345 RepID=A0ABD0LHC6_9CAEN
MALPVIHRGRQSEVTPGQACPVAAIYQAVALVTLRYDWEAIPSYWTTLSQFSNCGPLLENRAAMIWNWPSAEYVVRIPTEASVVLGYNEPNHKDQVTGILW